MAIDKVVSASITTDAVGPTQLNEASNYAFTGTVTGAGESNIPYFDVKPSSNIAYTDNTSHIIQFATVNKDTASGFNNSTYKYTVQSGQAGQYVINFGFRMNPTDCNRASCGLKLNDVAFQTVETDGGGGSTYASASSSILMTLAVSDVLHLTYYQNSSVNSVLRTDGTYFSGFKLTSTT